MVTPVRTAGWSLRAAGVDVDVRQLAEDDALLLRGVQRRAVSVLALAAARTWPYAELDTLTGFLRAAVLPHAINEEDRLYPDGVAAPFTQLRAEHAHIYALTEQLEHIDAASCTLPELRRMVDGLEHHMITEHTALAALDDVPCVPDPDPTPPLARPI
jgi:Hemerythrin HHE cation binding domain